MFRIRKEQKQALEDATFPVFADELVEHLKEFTPLHSRVLADEGLRKMVYIGKERAAKYGMTGRGPTRLYVELIFILGVEFDTDPQYPWAEKTLNDPEINDQNLKAERLWEQEIEYLHTATGPQRIYAKEALRRVRELPYEGPSLASPHYEDEVLSKMRELHPERCEYLGEQPLRSLIVEGREEARKYKIDSDAAVTLIIGLMFVLGHGVLRDPKYAFTRSTLTNENEPDPNKRAERLHSKAMTYLDHAMNFQR